MPNKPSTPEEYAEWSRRSKAMWTPERRAEQSRISTENWRKWRERREEERRKEMAMASRAEHPSLARSIVTIIEDIVHLFGRPGRWCDYESCSCRDYADDESELDEFELTEVEVGEEGLADTE